MRRRDVKWCSILCAANADVCVGKSGLCAGRGERWGAGRMAGNAMEKCPRGWKCAFVFVKKKKKKKNHFYSCWKIQNVYRGKLKSAVCLHLYSEIGKQITIAVSQCCNTEGNNYLAFSFIHSFFYLINPSIHSIYPSSIHLLLGLGLGTFGPGLCTLEGGWSTQKEANTKQEASGPWPLVPYSWPLAPGLWHLAPGSWPLAPGPWLLAPGSWPLAPGLGETRILLGGANSANRGTTVPTNNSHCSTWRSDRL